MAERPRRKNAGNRLADIITTISEANDKEPQNSDDVFHDSYDEANEGDLGTEMNAGASVGATNANSDLLNLGQGNHDNDSISMLENELADLRKERQKATLKAEIEKEREAIRRLQTPLEPPNVPALPGQSGITGLPQQSSAATTNINAGGIQRMVDYLEKQMSILKSKAWARRTTFSYRTHLKCYLDFCERLKKCPIPAEPRVLQLYVTHLAKVKNFKYSTIRQYLNIVTHLHRMSGLMDPIPNDYQLQHLLMGVKRELGVAQVPVEAITPQLLLEIKSTLNFTTIADIAFWCACLIAFYGLLRPCNVTVQGTLHSSRDLRRTDVVCCSWGFLLSLRCTKTIQFREKEVNVCLPKVDNAVCPVAALQTLFAHAASADPLGPLLLMDNGQPLTYSYFCHKLKLSLAQAGITHHNIKGHSFRRGGATWLSRLGIPLDAIKAIGYWSSDSVMRYIEPDFSQKVQIMHKFGKSLCT